MNVIKKTVGKSLSQRMGALYENTWAPQTHWDIQLFKNMDCFKKGLIQDQWACSNIVTNEGKNALNDIMWGGGTTPQITNWYIALFENEITPSVEMTYAVPLYTETLLYAGNRPAFVPAASVDQAITNLASRAVFTINATVSIWGCSLVGAIATKGDVAGAGTLYSASRFALKKDCIDTNILYIGVSIAQL